MNPELIAKLTNLANKHADGHFTIAKFTTNYRVGLGTPSERDDFDQMAVGLTLESAIETLIRNVETKTANDPNAQLWGRDCS